MTDLSPLVIEVEGINKNEKTCKQKIVKYLNYVLDEVYIPELGKVKKGKVRDIYMTDKNVVMFASDRVSAFDRVLNTLIPFKGYILNLISLYAFANTTDIVPNALICTDNLSSVKKNIQMNDFAPTSSCLSSSNLNVNEEESSNNDVFEKFVKKYMVDGNVIIQKKMKNLNVEFIVRGYLWGSMAKAYEEGEENYCGISFKSLQNCNNNEKLIKYEKFANPILTPTTKAEIGEHDAPLTDEEVEKLIGKKLNEETKCATLKLYRRGNELANKCNLILIDTKYEFGLDENNVLHVIDEVNTPDSSRLCDKFEYEEKFKQIKEIMKKGEFKNMDELLKKHPDLKIKEYSKQYVRDVLLSHGLHSSNMLEVLTQEQVVECVYRYIYVYERITQRKFIFPSISDKPKKRILKNLTEHNVIKGCCAAILAGSSSDMPHIQKLQTALQTFDIPNFVRICSAHKQISKLESLINDLNRSIESLVLIAVAGGTDALSGTASFHSLFPVISCPPPPPSSLGNDVNFSCLFNPPGSSNAYIIRIDNVAKFVAQTFSVANEEIANKLVENNEKKIKQLEDADKLL